MSFSDAELLALADGGVTTHQLVEAIIAGRQERRERAAARKAGRAPIPLRSEDEISAAAVRMRRMRARQRAEALERNTGVTGSVTPVTPERAGGGADQIAQGTVVASLSAERAARGRGERGVTGVTPVTRSGQKEVPPTPPLRKTLPPKPPRRNAASPDQIWLDARDPVFREIDALRGKTSPTDKQGGWWFDARLVAEAEGRLSAKVTAIGPSALAIAAATGPPAAAGTG